MDKLGLDSQKSKEFIKNEKQLMTTKFKCTEEGLMKEFVGFLTTVRRNTGENARLQFS